MADVSHGGSLWTNEYTWLALALAGLIAVAWKPVSRAITGSLDERSAQIRKDLDEAARLKTEAEGLLAEFKAKHAEAMKTADEIVAHAREEAGRIAAEAATALEESLKRREQMAMQRIAQAEGQALAEVRSAAVDVAIAATQRLVEENLDPARADALIDAAIADVQRKIA
ncbi:MAG: F0F1 ATP synthase subunit B [Alphaproteobacteria bacterium]|nr:F0F1 ATP synthase subunit B [Alphaproteobacteria bacterium]